MLVDRFVALDPATRMRERGPDGPVSFSDVLGVLPPVAAWAELAAEIRRRPLDAAAPAMSELALRALAARLIGDTAEEVRLREPLTAALATSEAKEAARELIRALASGEAESGALVRGFTQQLELREKGMNPEMAYSFEVPDLVSAVGKEGARPLLRRAVVLPVANLNAEGRETAALLREVALEAIAELKVPRWALAAAPGSGALFEALEKRFPVVDATGMPALDAEPSRRSREYEQARSNHLTDLIAAGRTAEAANLVLALSASRSADGASLDLDVDSLTLGEHVAEAADFLRGLLTQNPALPLWEAYVKTAAFAGHSAEALALLRSTVADEKIGPAVRARIIPHLAAAFLADDQVEPGVAELRKILANPLPLKSAQAEFRGAVEQQVRATVTLMQLGQSLARPALVDEALAARERWSRLTAGTTDYTAVIFAQALRKTGRSAEAEKMIELAARDNLVGNGPGGGSDYMQTTFLTELAGVYHAAGRPAEVLALLERAPQWGAGDLAELGDGSSGELQFYAAHALAETGRMAEAKSVLNLVLDRQGGYDPAYALLLRIGGADAGARLDALVARDRFEERPLIWKAEWLRRAGRMEEAEQTVRAAIAVDPSDGEQPKGDRMRAYAVLAEVRAARGDVEQSKFLRGVVQAIRESETADSWREAGLLQRAIAGYRRALGAFADAYCIQSRLAVQLNDLGKFDEAEEHYRRAYELMPDSFGRVESHCFGCERAFGPARAQGVAERVFAALVEKTPDRPQVHYLLGYLRMEQGRPAAALVHFRRAVELDADYLNAWKKIAALSREMRLPAADRDAAVLTILRLDPFRRHASAGLEDLNDLRGLFGQIAALRAAFPEEPTQVFPLRASRERIEQQKRTAGAGRYFPNFNRTGAGLLSGREAAQQNRFLAAVAGLMEPMR